MSQRHAVGLLRAEEIICRAWDEAMNTQPDSFTWNLMGMLNNCHYRVKVPIAAVYGLPQLCAELTHASMSRTAALIPLREIHATARVHLQARHLKIQGNAQELTLLRQGDHPAPLLQQHESRGSDKLFCLNKYKSDEGGRWDRLSS